MTDELQKQIFSKNLCKYLSNSNKSQKEVADAINVSPQTFNTWCQGIALPRMGKIQKLADYFKISKSDLIDDETPQDVFVLADDEVLLIERYRNSDTSIKAMIQKMLS